MFETQVAAPLTDLQVIGRRVAIIACLVKDVVPVGVGWHLVLSFGTLDETATFFAISFITHISGSEGIVARVKHNR